MTVALADFEFAVDPVGQRVGFNLASPRAQAHGAAKFFNAAQLTQLIDYAMRCRGIELTGICVRQPDHVAGKLNASGLHPEANSEVRNLFLAGIADRNQHALNPTLAETTRNEKAIVAFELRFVALVASFQALGFDPIQL